MNGIGQAVITGFAKNEYALPPTSGARLAHVVHGKTYQSTIYYEQQVGSVSIYLIGNLETMHEWMIFT